ncbi:MAG: ankyrin repeat domain-containing protein [Bacteroidota bacterium]
MKIIRLFSITILSLILFAITGCMRSPAGSADAGKEENREDQVTPAATTTSEPATEEALRQSALDGMKEEVKSLLEAGTKVDAPDVDGHTALMFAAFNGHSEVVLMLLDQGAALDRRDMMGRTALLYASTGPFPETVKILLDKGAKPNVVDSDEHFSPLMHAAAEGNLAVVKVLVEYGADLSLKDVDGDDAESFARQAGHQQVADYLHSLR